MTPKDFFPPPFPLSDKPCTRFCWTAPGQKWRHFFNKFQSKIYFINPVQDKGNMKTSLHIRNIKRKHPFPLHWHLQFLSQAVTICTHSYCHSKKENKYNNSCLCFQIERVNPQTTELFTTVSANCFISHDRVSSGQDMNSHRVWVWTHTYKR